MSWKKFFESSQNWYSWLSPRGEFFPISYQSHDLSIRKIANTDMHDAFRQGWMRITHYDSQIVANNPNKTLNYKQKAALIDMAIETKASTLEFDNDRSNFVIWSPGE